MEQEPVEIKEIIDATVVPKLKKARQKSPDSAKMSRLGKLGGLARQGTKNKKTILKEEALKEYEQKMLDNLYAVTRAQLMMAVGAQYLYKIEKRYEGKKVVSREARRVTDAWEMEAFLNDYINDVHDTSPTATYYFLVAKDPNVKAISDILDRLGGKPTQKVVTMDITPKVDAAKTNPKVIEVVNQFQKELRNTLMYGNKNKRK